MTKPKAEAKLTPQQLSEGTIILNRMVGEVKEAEITKKTAIITAAQNLEKKGFPIDGICHRITMRAAEMNVSSDYVRECLPSKYKNQAQVKIAKTRLSYSNHSSKNLLGEDQPCQVVKTDCQTIEVKTKEDIEPLIPMTRKNQNNQNKAFSKFEDSDLDLKGLDLEKLPEQFRPFIVKLIKENGVLKTSNARFKEENKDLKFEDSFKQGVIDNLTKQNRQFRKDFADNYESKYSEFKARIDEVESKNASFNYILVGLAGISEPGISDEMRLDTVNNFIKRHYDKIAEQAEKHKQEEALIQAQNLKSWE